MAGFQLIEPSAGEHRPGEHGRIVADGLDLGGAPEPEQRLGAAVPVVGEIREHVVEAAGEQQR